MDKYIDSVSEWKEALYRLRETKIAGKINPINIKNLNLDDSLENNKNAELIRTLSALLPEDKEQSGEFSNWCEKQERGGVRPARDFWMNWIDCIYDPLSLFIEGRVKQHQTIADEDDDSTREYFMPTLTKNHLKWGFLASLFRAFFLEGVPFHHFSPLGYRKTVLEVFFSRLGRF